MNTAQFFKENIFTESLVIEFTYQAQNSVIVLICDCAHDVLVQPDTGVSFLKDAVGKTYQRDIRKVEFREVSNYRVSGHMHRDFLKNPDVYLARDTRRNVSIQALLVHKVNGAFAASIDFGGFGIREFHFEHVVARKKLLRAIDQDAKSGQWTYEDIDTGKVTEFYQPFGDEQ